GLARNAARRQLTTAGFKVSEQKVASDKVRAGLVVAQSPGGRTLAEGGTIVRIDVSSGPERLAVPNVVGKTVDEARTALDAFRVTVREKEDEEAEPGSVLAQDPASGTLPAGATVRLTVAVEVKQVTVPDVVGRSQNLATKLLSGRGFEVAVEEVAVDTLGMDGVVSKQDPETSDTKVDRGITVTITVGRFDPPLNPEPGTETTTTPTTTTTTPG
ncbi:MAG: PASTA domain-containing protein, partial [Solirubrobacteraceae bacterium]